MAKNDELSIMLQNLIKQWIIAFNAHDVSAIVELYADDAILSDSGMRYPRQGRRQIEHWFSQRFRSMPTITYTPTGQFLRDSDHVAITWVASGSTPRLMGQAWLSRPFQVHGVSVFTLRNGLILRQHGYYDHLTVVERVLPFLKWLPSRM